MRRQRLGSAIVFAGVAGIGVGSAVIGQLPLGIDWDATGSMLAGWAAWAGIGAVLYAAHIGRASFAEWKRQKQEERRLDVAEKILTLAYKLKETLAAMRSPFISAAELDAAEKTLVDTGTWAKLTGDQQSRYRTAQALLERANAYRDDWNQIWDFAPVALAVFGQDVRDQLQALWRQRQAFLIAVESYLDLDEQADRDFARHVRQDITSSGDPGKISQAVDAAVGNLERVMLPIIRADHQSAP